MRQWRSLPSHLQPARSLPSEIRAGVLLLLGALLLYPPAWAGGHFTAVDVLPAPKTVVIDGHLQEWDQRRFLDTLYAPALYPNFSMRLGLMYDANGLYVGAHLVDATPLVNAADPARNPQEGGQGDALVVRVSAGSGTSERRCQVTLWRSTATGNAVACLDYGQHHAGRVTVSGKESGAAFSKDADGRGYSLEAKIPWERLKLLPRACKAGEMIALTVQPVWGNAAGTAPMLTYREVVAEGAAADEGPGSWGRALFARDGTVPPRANPALTGSGDPAATPLKLSLTLPDPQARTISLGLFSAEKGLLRSLPVTVRREAQLGAAFELAWDGLDADGRPIPPGAYRLKQLTHRGIGQKFIASLHNSGNPPWRTDDGLGQWGGDWSPSVAAAADAKFVYLGWGSCEAGPALVCVKKELDATGCYQKAWGASPAMYNDVGFTVTALATDGERLFVAQDGKTYGGLKDKQARAFAAVTLYDVKTGQVLQFPFGKPRLPVAQWDAGRCEAENRKPLFARRQTGDFGPQQLGANLTGIAVAGDRLYAALFLENKVVAYNWKSGETLREFVAEAPSGVAVAADGRVIVATATGVLRIDPATGVGESLATGGLARPWGVTLDRAGNLVVADCGAAMQVKLFTPEGKLLRTVGKAGGRAWVGAYDPSGMLMPAGLAVDGDGKLWVTEHDEFPRRVSVWDAAGKVVGDFHGPGVPQSDRGVDPDNPRRINVQLVEYELDYDTGQSKCLATLWRPHLDGWTPVANCGRASRFLIRTVQGRQYGFLDHGYSDRLGVVFIRKGDRFQPCASLGFSPCVPVMPWGNEESGFGMIPNPEQWLGPDKWKAVWDAGAKGFCHPMQLWHRWIDRNDDGIVQATELSVERRDWSDVNVFSIAGVDAELTLWGQMGTQVYRVPVTGFTEHGVPLYPERRAITPLFAKLSRADASIWKDTTRPRVYGFDAKGGDSRMRGEYAAVSCYDVDGKLRWLYRDTWLNFASDAPFWKPGYVIGVGKIIGQADLENGVSLLVMPGYYGDYSMLSTEGLWVHQFCQDNRLGGGAGPDSVFIENMTGIFYRNAQNGKVYLIGGDIDARVWEVTGLETIRTAETPLTITAGEFAAASAAASRTKSAVVLGPIALGKAGKLTIDGKTTDWAFDRAVTIDAGVGRGAKVALAYDATYLYAAFKVDDRSPLVNTATDSALLFKGGDLCDVMLAADPTAAPVRVKPATGDSRLSFSVLNGKPLCVLYQAKSTGPPAPKSFRSPTGEELFERVLVVETAKVAVQRTESGYELEAAVPLAELGFTPIAGQATRGDVGVLFGTDGGGRTILRAYYANNDTMTVEDVPTEARLTPAKWTTVEVRP
jgi:hypothetical protein